MRERRGSTVRNRATAHELPSKSLELEQRIGRLEVALSRIEEALEAYTKEVAATRAQLDYLVARARF